VEWIVAVLIVGVLYLLAHSNAAPADSSAPIADTYSDPVGGSGPGSIDLGFTFPSSSMTTAEQLAAAIKQVETGGNYSAVGKSGEYGAYQFMPGTWASWARQWLGSPDAPPTAENQDKVAVSQIQDWLNRGFTPEQIALLWNGGTTVPKAGVNAKGVAYDSGAYASKVIAAFKNLFGGNNG
jgi:soluble lytic murein transglycosylase-like protein